MEWFDSFKYKPKHGTQIFIWDRINQKRLHLHSLWEEKDWRPNSKFPCWQYVFDNDEPILLQPERSKREDSVKDPPHGDLAIVILPDGCTKVQRCGALNTIEI